MEMPKTFLLLFVTVTNVLTYRTLQENKEYSGLVNKYTYNNYKLLLEIKHKFNVIYIVNLSTYVIAVSTITK